MHVLLTDRWSALLESVLNCSLEGSVFWTAVGVLAQLTIGARGRVLLYSGP